MLLVVQDEGIQCAHLQQTKSPLKWALLGLLWALPAAAFMVVAFSQIKLCQSNLNRFFLFLPLHPAIHQRMPLVNVFALPYGASGGRG